MGSFLLAITLLMNCGVDGTARYAVKRRNERGRTLYRVRSARYTGGDIAAQCPYHL
jgi:hypothetical protein